MLNVHNTSYLSHRPQTVSVSNFLSGLKQIEKMQIIVVTFLISLAVFVNFVRSSGVYPGPLGAFQKSCLCKGTDKYDM